MDSQDNVQELLNKQILSKEISKKMFDEVKDSRMSYTSTIKIGTKTYTIENQSNKKYERYTLLESIGAEEVSVEDIADDMEFDFLDDLFVEDLDSEDIIMEDEDPTETQSNEDVLMKWKKAYSKGPNELLEDAINEIDEEYDNSSVDEDLNPNGIAVRDLARNTLVKEPPKELLDKEYFYKNNKIQFDFYRYCSKEAVTESASEVQPDGQIKLKRKVVEPKEFTKKTYGDEEKFEELSYKINLVFNFTPKESEFKGQFTRTVDRNNFTIKSYARDDVKYNIITNSYNMVLGYEYFRGDTEIKIDLSNINAVVKDVKISTVDLGLPYKEEIIKTDKTSELKLFKENKYNKTLILPHPKVFTKFLELGYIESPDTHYEIVDTKNKLIDYAEKYLLPQDILGYDAETEGLQAYKWVKRPHRVVTHSFSWDTGYSMIIPIRMRYCQNIPVEEAHEILRPILEQKNILAHNGAADTRFLLPDNIVLNLVEDTMHLIRCIMPFATKAAASLGMTRSLDDLCKRAFGYDMIDLNKYVFKPAGVEFDFALLNELYMIWYGCPDTDLMLRLWKGLRPKLDITQEHSYNQIVAYSHAMAILASYPGIGVNTEKMMSAREDALRTTKNMEQIMYKYTNETPQTLKLSSAKALSNFVFSKMGVPASKGKKTDSGALSADKHVMTALAKEKALVPSNVFKKDITDEDGEVILKASDLNNSAYPFCMLHRKWADLTKDITAFYNGILNNTIEDVYYENYRTAQTDTYRDTARIQITKKNIKYSLGAYNEKYGFCSLDFNTEEFRITVNLSTDMALVKMLQGPESDAHTMVAAEMYNKEPSEIDKSLRDPIKSCNFGIIYGMKLNRLTKQLKNVEHPTEKDIEDIRPIYELYLYKRAEMLAPLETSKDHVRATGWIQNALGYKMIYNQVIDVPDFFSQVFDFSRKETPVPRFDPEKRAENMGMIMNRSGNFPIQSLAAAQLKDAIIKFYEELSNANMIEYISVPLSVHDEVGIIYHKEHVDPYWLFTIVHKSFYSEMEYLNKPKEEIAPLYIGVGFGTTWGNAKSDLVEFPVSFQHVLLEEYKRGESPILSAEEDHQLHFLKRIKDYMLGRITDMFRPMLDEKVFKRNQMKYEINQNVFLGKKMHELFKTNDYVEDENGNGKLVINIDKYVGLIMEHNNLDIDDYEIIDGPEIKKETKNDDDGVIEFFYKPELHPNVMIEHNYITVDVRDVYAPVIRQLADYFRTLHNPDYHYHNKTVRFMVSNTEYVKLEGINVLGVTMTFKDDIDSILKTGVSDRTGVSVTAEPAKQLSAPPILYDYTQKYIIFNLDVVTKIHPNMQNDLSNIISRYSSSQKDFSYRVWFLINGEYKVTNIFMDGIPTGMQEDLRQCSVKYNYYY